MPEPEKGKKRVKKILLFVDSRNPRALGTAHRLQELLAPRRVRATIAHEFPQSQEKKVGGGYVAEYDLVVSFGGDGTLLRVAREAAPYGVPVLSVDLGGLGFLSSVSPEGLRRAMERILEEDFSLDKRMMLDVRIIEKSKRGEVEKFYASALNEVLIHKGESSRLVHLVAVIDGKEAATYSADGLMVATPTGSTAYALSAGGPIASPRVEAFLMIALCPHSLSARPLVISAQEKIRVVNLQRDRKLTLTVDGQTSKVVHEGEEVYIDQSPYTTRLVTFEEEFYQKLRTRLDWAGEYRRMELRELVALTQAEKVPIVSGGSTRRETGGRSPHSPRSPHGRPQTSGPGVSTGRSRDAHPLTESQGSARPEERDPSQLPGGEAASSGQERPAAQPKKGKGHRWRKRRRKRPKEGAGA